MKELVEIIAKSLVDYPDEVVVNETVEEDTITIELKVAPDDMGKVIGKQGRIAKSIAKQSGAKAIRLYSCHNLSKKDYESGQSYLSLMTKNASSLREALR